MGKKFLSLVFITLLTALNISMPIYAKTYTDYKEAIKDANEFLKPYEENYYAEETPDGKKINKSLAIDGSSAFEVSGSSGPVFVYGGMEEASRYEYVAGSGGKYYDTATGKYRALGRAMNGIVFPNPSFPADYGPSDDSDKIWLHKDNSRGLYFINSWLDGRTAFFDIDDFIDNIVPDKLPTNIDKKYLRDYFYVVQPPTQHSWGLAIGFYYLNHLDPINTRYRTLYLKPFDMLLSDIIANFSTLQHGAYKGNEVTIEVEVKSTFGFDLNHSDNNSPPFKWTILNKNTNKAILNVKYTGETSSSGNVEVSSNGTRRLKASFTMPDSDVIVRFEVNANGTRIQESNLNNNKVEHEIKTLGEVESFTFDLDYDVLSREIKKPLLENGEMRVELDDRDWLNAAIGSIKITNLATGLFRESSGLRVSQTIAINTLNNIIVEKPNIGFTFNRTDFNDNPQGKTWRNLTNPSIPVERQGQIEFGGSVNRTYGYYCESEYCRTLHEATLKAVFNNGVITGVLKAYIYNGTENVPPKIFNNLIHDNTLNSLNKSLEWESEPYKFNVVRWMRNVYADGRNDNYIPVDGQYQRTFTQQNTGHLDWSFTENAETMVQGYQISRNAATKANSRSSEYEKAVFATDKDFQDVDYPIKSGYYFNPTGTYTFEVNTVTYKTSQNNTKDHEDLVKAAIDSFRYESDLMYVRTIYENGKQKAIPVNIANQELSSFGNNYSRKLGVLGVGTTDALVSISSATNYTKQVEELESSQNRTQASNATHTYWKGILEGYSESGTPSSFNDYKYKEYIKDGQKIYKITETSTVTIQVNPSNTKAYTLVHMPDGKYNIRVWVDNINLGNLSSEYKKLGVINGITTLDSLEVTVRGSMYDDISS